MKKLNSILFAILVILSSSCCYSMDGKRGLSKEDLKRERTVLLEISSQRPEKKRVVKEVHHLRWQEASIEGTHMSTLTPIEDIEQVILEVDPIAKAMYEDNVEELEQILCSKSPDILCKTPHLIDGIPYPASLLEIGAARCSYKCLRLFRELLTMPPPNVTLVKLSCYTLTQNNGNIAFVHPDIDISARAASGKMCHMYANTMPALRRLFELSQKSAYTLARNTGNFILARLLVPIPE